MTELQQYISTYFSIEQDHLKQVAELFTETQLAKGEYFVKTEHYSDKLSFVRSGYIRVFKEYNNKEITQWISDKGFFITDLSSFMFRTRARWNIQAMTDCTLFTIQGENYKKLNQVIPNWSELEKRFIAGCFLALEDRIFNHLSLSAEERYDDLFEKNKEMFNQIPQQYLASMLGMTPETFSRIRKKKIS